MIGLITSLWATFVCILLLGIHVGLGYIVLEILNHIYDYEIPILVVLACLIFWPVGVILCIVAALYKVFKVIMEFLKRRKTNARRRIKNCRVR